MVLAYAAIEASAGQLDADAGRRGRRKRPGRGTPSRSRRWILVVPPAPKAGAAPLPPRGPSRSRRAQPRRRTARRPTSPIYRPTRPRCRPRRGTRSHRELIARGAERAVDTADVSAKRSETSSIRPHRRSRLRQGLRADLRDHVQEGAYASSTRSTSSRPRRATTGGTCSTGTRTAWRSASAASCVRGPARPTPSTSRAATTPNEARFSPGERYGKVYQINYLRCIFCGLCIEACPTRSLTMRAVQLELALDNRQDLICTRSS